MDRKYAIALWIPLIAFVVCLHAANLFLGDLNQDEGWYLYAARLVNQGCLPYLDFATTQGPVMPFVYAVAEPLVQAWGLAGGRLFTAFLGLAGAGLAAWLASRLVRGNRIPVVLMVVALTAANVYQNYFCTVVKTYSLTVVLLTAGFLLLTAVAGRRGSVAAFAAGLFFGLAAATRSSAILTIPAVGLVLFAGVRQVGILRPFWFLSGSGLALAAAFVPFWWSAPEAVWFALWDYHAGREPGGWLSVLAYKAGFASRLIQVYFVAFALFAAAVVRAVLNRLRDGSTAFRIPSLPVVALWLTVVLMTAAHGLAPFPYDDYQVIVYPLFVAALCAWVCDLWTPAAGGTGGGGATAGVRMNPVLPVLALVYVLGLVSALSSPMNQEWFVGRRDRIWWPLKTETPLAKLQQAAEMVRLLTAKDERLLTQDPYLAVESGRALPRGLELGQFSYYPGWTRERAERCRVLNAEMMRELLDTVRAPVAAFSGYGFAIRSPEILPLSPGDSADLWARVYRRYAPFRTIPDFGQAATPLQILLLKEP
ncbi:MAG: hypothetical protein A2340_02115 [Lentisphaerae bacterium RIFOXYB12_FULL_60_10]|nr:MAG: hypothetical protein A2340_02115 [Lentisphaerae bacterium RIFOXYB12_FULL_60_10]